MFIGSSLYVYCYLEERNILFIYCADMVSADALAEAFISLELDDTELSVDMMKMWTNFARTG